MDDSDDGVEEGVGESSWPPAAAASSGPASSSGGGGGGASHGPLLQDVRKGIYQRLRDIGNEEALTDPFFEQLLEEHYERLPISYSIDLQVDKAEDVLLHRRILAECADPDKRPVFHARFLRVIHTSILHNARLLSVRTMSSASLTLLSSAPMIDRAVLSGGEAERRPVPSGRQRDGEFQQFPCERMMEDLSLGRRKGVDDFEAISAWRDTPEIRLVHEIIFSSIDKPKLLSQLSALLSEIGLNIREAHVFSTTDGLCLDVFVVDGWETEPSLSNPTNSSTSERIRELQEKIGDSEFDRNLLQPMDKFASGSSGDLYRGTYLGMDVAIKYLRAEHVNDSSNVEFLQEIMILRIAIGISRGMDYLHQNNIIHRDLKTANLLIGNGQVVKIADFGVSRHRSQEGDMTAETGTYRWMAPEVINHKAYDHRADVFSFAIVLWELVTSKIPYENLTPLQAALSVRQVILPQFVGHKSHEKMKFEHRVNY
ncbi:hypothetical protein ACQ4PT_041833 [Festuca glaucescens]